MSENGKVIVIDGLTNSVIEREMTQADIEAREKSNLDLAKFQAEQDAKVLARESALAKLAALGLTEAEIASL